MRTSRFLRLAAVVAVGALSLAACSAAAEPETDSDVQTVKIGFLDSVTGAYSFTGVEQQLSLRLAAEKINASDSNIHVEIVEKDDQSTPAGAVAGMQALLADPEIVAIVGMTQTELAAATIPLLAADGRPAVFLQVTDLTGRTPNIFSMGPPTGVVSSKLAEYAYTESDAKTAAIIYNVQPTFSAANDAFLAVAKDMGVEVLSDQGVPLTTTTFASQITNALSGDPDVIGVSTLAPSAGSIFSALRSAGFEGTIFAQQGAINSAAKEAAGTAADGVLVGSYWDTSVADTSALSKEYLDAWTAAHPDLPLPDVFGLEGYDALLILHQAMEAIGGADKADLADALAKGTFSAALQDKLKFTKDGFADLEGYVIELNSAGANKQVG